MIICIIAGGSGTRLWPLSTPDYPKHLLNIASDKSLLRNTYERAKKLSKDIYVVTEVSHAHHVKNQLPELKDDAFIIEPGRRGTANCIVAALEHVARTHAQSEPVAILSADHHIRDVRGFVHSFRLAADVSKSENRIVLVGVEPDYPATGFGYIQKDGLFDKDRQVFNVDSFKEKPERDTATKYIKSGQYLWNCGYFVGSVDTFLSNMKKHAPQLANNYDLLRKAGDKYEQTYMSFKDDTIDYALIEKVDNLLVVPASFDWMDLGSFSDIHKAEEQDERNNHTSGDNIELLGVENAYVYNEGSKKVAVIGLDNVVVVNTPNGIIVARKDQAHKIKEVLKKFK